MAPGGVQIRGAFVEGQCARSIDEFGPRRKTGGQEFFYSENATAAIEGGLDGRAAEFDARRGINCREQCDAFNGFLDGNKSGAIFDECRNQSGEIVAAKGRQERAGIERAGGDCDEQRRNESLVAAGGW